MRADYYSSNSKNRGDYQSLLILISFFVTLHSFMGGHEIVTQVLPDCRQPLTFRKEERLHHKSLVESLFRHGSNIYEFPFRLTWMALNSEQLSNSFRNGVPDGIGGLQMMVTVPKKKRRKAVDRVLMRRRIREAYRLNRLPLKKILENRNDIRTLQLAFVFIHDKNLPFAMIEERFRTLMHKLIKRIESIEKI